MKDLREYQSFESLSELNEYISNVLGHYELTTTERELIWLIGGHSCKFLGVSFLKVQTMADKLKVSYKTAQRAVRKLREFGIIERVKVLRPSRGGFGASLTIISPNALTYREEAFKPAPERSQEVIEKKETIPFKAKTLKDLKERKKEVVELDYSYLENSHIPSEFIQTVKPFISSAKEIYSLWGKVLLASNKYAPEVLHFTEVGVQAFKQTVFAHKLNKIKKDFNGYFFGVLSQMFTVEQRRVFMSSDSFYNWLEDY